jgi:sulfofructose kinase
MKYDVVGLGAVSVDFLCLLDSFPQRGSKTRVLQFAMQGGGLVGTALVTLARLGARVCYVGKLGKDEFSEFLVREFEREGVDLKLKREEGILPIRAVVLVDSKGERTIAWTDEGAPRLSPGEVEPEELARSARILHLDYVGLELEAAVEIAKAARDSGTKVSIDAEKAVPGVRRLLNLTDLLVVPEDFSYQLTGETDPEKAARLLHRRHGSELVCITAGERGCFCLAGGEFFHQPAFRVRVVDTTGCGDVFHGAFLYGVLRGWDLRRVARFASAVAALKCRKLGGRAGIPRLEEVEEFLATA